MRSITGTGVLDAAGIEDAAADIVGGDLELFMASADAPPAGWLCVAWPLEFSHMFSSKMLSDKFVTTARWGKRFSTGLLPGGFFHWSKSSAVTLLLLNTVR